MSLDLHVQPGHQPGNTLAAIHLVMGVPGFIWVGDYEPCAECDKPCTWVDLAFECRLHPGPCSEKAWDAFNWAQMFDFLAAEKSLGTIDSLTAMRCPNADCKPPKYCGLCKGTGQIP